MAIERLYTKSEKIYLAFCAVMAFLPAGIWSMFLRSRLSTTLLIAILMIGAIAGYFAIMRSPYGIESLIWRYNRFLDWVVLTVILIFSIYLTTMLSVMVVGWGNNLGLLAFIGLLSFGVLTIHWLIVAILVSPWIFILTWGKLNHWLMSRPWYRRELNRASKIWRELRSFIATLNPFRK